MNGDAPLPAGDQYVIGRTTSGGDVIRALARRGCPDLTADIDLAASSNLPLAGGGLCDVYRGRLNNGGHIAIKSLRLYEIPGERDGERKILKRAARELYYWSKLKHPNILPLTGLAMFRGHLSMISEWMDNGTLGVYIGLNPNADRIGLCIDICAGLSYIHDNGMIHGDIKAANVVVSRSGTAMITDFGSSQLKELTLKFTKTITYGFSVRWAAPELLLGEGDESRVSKESDVYAYGMTILETITGKIPFEELSEPKVLIMVAVQHQTPARPEVGISNGVWEVLQRCWAREKSKRPNIRCVETLLRDIYFQTWIKAKKRDSIGTSHFKTVSPPGIWNHQMKESAMPYAEPDSAGKSEDPPREYKRKLRNVSNLAEEYTRKGQLAEAESLELEVVAVMKRVLGEDHPETLRGRSALAVIYRKQGQLAEAESVEVKVLAARRRMLVDDHPDTLQCMNNLAVTYRKQGRLAEAGAVGAEALAAMKRVLGEDHPDTLQCMGNLVTTYGRQGRLKEAESLGIKVLAAMKRVLGEDHADTLQSMYILAFTYTKQGRLAEAESLGIEVLAARKRALGEDHPDTLQCMNNLAVTYRKQGRLPEAGVLGAQVLAAMKPVLGEDHPDTLQCMGNLVTTYGRQGRLTEAESLGVEVVAIMKRVLGKDHPSTLRSMHVLVTIYEHQSRSAEAESLGVEVIASAKRVLGEDHPHTVLCMNTLADIYEKRGRLAEAETLGVQVLAARKRILGPNHPGVAHAIRRLGRIQQAQGRHAEFDTLTARVDNLKVMVD